ncbi:rod shape-determining protein [Spiroplasma culicicola]|uniref:Cell shape determining protein MreB n=1 Tax=Spiroplasma culicicola AES-1 TaxID=1276246 RepID=W6A8W1_9MOLU|nr:rod shape-determining protein [Spiroplasma culicicola]AHI53401.1 cell shape determining protein MreB [Spiroplasma culicicola AES-1]
MAKITLNQRRHIAIDVGTSKTKIHIENLGLVFNAATLVALDFKTRRVVAVGDDAKKFVGKLSGSLQLKYPMKRGVITDMAMLKLFLSAVLSKYKNELDGAIVTLACPTSVTTLERNSLIKSIKELGVYHVQAEDDVKLALLGAGVDITKPNGYLCLDIGAGKSTAAIIATNGTVCTKWSKSGGNSMDLDIIKHLKSKEQMLIGEITAESIKNSIATLIKTKEPLKTSAYGYDLNSGLPKEVILQDKDILKIVQSTFGNLTNLITTVLEEAPNELAGDVIKNGIVVTGGVALIPGVKFYLEDFFEIPVRVAKNALTATIDGAIAHKELTIEDMEFSSQKEEFF